MGGVESRRKPSHGRIPTFQLSPSGPDPRPWSRCSALLLTLTATLCAASVPSVAAEPADGDLSGILTRAEKLADSDVPAAEALAGQALALAETNDDDAGRVAALTTLGRFALKADRPADALPRLEQARDLAAEAGLTGQTGVIARALGDARYRLGDYDTALASYLDAIAFYQRSADRDSRLRIAHLDIVVGNVFDKVGDRDKALEYYGRARDAYAELDYEAGVAGATLNLGNLYQEMGRYDDALTSFAAAEAAAERLGNDSLRTMAWVNSCGALIAMDRPDDALKRCRAALELALSTGNIRSEVHALLKIGEAEADLRQFSAAEGALTQALPLAESLGATALQRDGYAQLADVREALGDPQGALAAARRSHDLDRQLLDATRLAEMERLEAVRRSQRNELELEILRRQRRSDRIVRIALLGVLGLAGVVIGLLVAGYRQRSRAAVEIREANTRLEQAYARVDELSRTDDLTGLPNRRGLMTELEHERQRSARSRRPFALALLDLDEFKGLNDTYGHQAGDRVLTGVARLVRASLRAQDVVGRWGGDEFLLVLPETDREGARRLCDTLRTKIAASDLDTLEAGTATTVTVGFAVCRGHEESNACLQRADAALYRGKSTGRNTVVG